MTKSKDYKVYFARTKQGKKGIPISTALRAAVQTHGTNLPALDISNEWYQIRNLVRTGTVWQGVFAKLRPDPPHIVNSINQVEREIDLQHGDHIVEKCYFIFRERKNVMIWQVNRQAGSLHWAEKYLSRIFNEVVMLPLVMNEAELQRVLARDLYEIWYTYDRRTSNLSNPPVWTQGEFDMLKRVDAAHAAVKLRAERGGRLASAAKDLVRGLIASDSSAKKVRVRLTDESEFIELFSAPLRDSITVPIEGRYPLARAVYEELEHAYDRHRADIAEQPDGV
ncbi:MAG: DUF6731 family protein [Leptothrix sp. (in: b-proteobacteria)]